ncbi:hypothetical protein DICVIV_03709 [Dictyocaulus viviparus]|uniref:Kinesin motor domain-containing protein n=1 Tax=Dictyocaulus viviparus TaxID=29172 RepID=A0A0D8Y6C8_DICVI|nr:hypothetical protein DICVIV_03709 [Dictyocaulus viviparus]
MQIQILRLCAVVSRDDVTNGGIVVPATNQIHITGAVKSHSKNAFDNVFGPEIAQDQICSNVLPELVQGVFTCQDSSLIALGTKSKAKESLLYGTPPSCAGLFQSAITSIFKMTDQYRLSKPDTRYQIRMSALQYSQRENQLIDLLSPFNSDPRRRAVRVVDDPRTGAFLENESEIRVDSPDLALFYLNTVADHRIIGKLITIHKDEETYRTSHVFVFLSVYAYRTGTNELEGIASVKKFAGIYSVGDDDADGLPRSGIRLTFTLNPKLEQLQLVTTNRNGPFRYLDGAELTAKLETSNGTEGKLLPPKVFASTLNFFFVQMLRGLRENYLSQLLKCALCPSRLTTFFCTFAEKTDDNENVVQLASKLTRAKRNSRKNKRKKTIRRKHFNDDE